MTKTLTKLIRIIFGIILFSGYLIFLFQYIKLFSNFNIDDWRIAFVVAGLYYLIFLFLRLNRRNYPIESLINIRRDLVFERINVNLASSQVEIVLAGLESQSVVLQKMLKQLITALSDGNQLISEAKKNQDLLRTKIDEMDLCLKNVEKLMENELLYSDYNKVNEQIGKYNDLLSGLQPVVEDLTKNLESMAAVLLTAEKPLQKYPRLITWLLEQVPEFVYIIEPIIKKFQTEFDKFLETYKYTKESFNNNADKILTYVRRTEDLNELLRNNSDLIQFD